VLGALGFAWPLLGACGLSTIGAGEVPSGDGGAVDLGTPEAGADAPEGAASLDAGRNPEAGHDAANDGQSRSDVTDAGGAPEPDGQPDAPIVHAISLVQATPTAYQRVQSIDATITVGAGNLLVVVVYWDAASQTVTVTDTQANSWTPTTASGPGSCNGGMQPIALGQIWYAENAHGGNDTLTVRQSMSGNGNALGFFTLEYAGVAAAGSLDSQASQPAPAASNAMSPGDMTTTGAVDLIVAMFGDLNGAGQMTAGSGYTARGTDTGFFSLVQDNAPGVAPGTHNPGAFLPGGTSDDCWNSAAAAFKAR
jgi:hypothetical protein